jgi:hypothetical protein
MEEITTENIEKLIGKIPIEANAIERLVLGNDGTVQTLLSVLFGVPVKVEVISQIEMANCIVRWSKLVAEYSPDVKFVVCLAESIIDTTDTYNGFINGIKERKLGIGQLIAALGLKTNRVLLGFHSDDSNFSRTYSIVSSKTDDLDLDKTKLNIIITEVFPKAVFMKSDRVS